MCLKFVYRKKQQIISIFEANWLESPGELHFFPLPTVPTRGHHIKSTVSISSSRLLLFSHSQLRILFCNIHKSLLRSSCSLLFPGSPLFTPTVFSVSKPHQTDFWNKKKALLSIHATHKDNLDFFSSSSCCFPLISECCIIQLTLFSTFILDTCHLFFFYFFFTCGQNSELRVHFHPSGLLPQFHLLPFLFARMHQVVL